MQGNSCWSMWAIVSHSYSQSSASIFWPLMFLLSEVLSYQIKFLLQVGNHQICQQTMWGMKRKRCRKLRGRMYVIAHWRMGGSVDKPLRRTALCQFTRHACEAARTVHCLLLHASQWLTYVRGVDTFTSRRHPLKSTSDAHCELGGAQVPVHGCSAEGTQMSDM